MMKRHIPALLGLSILLLAGCQDLPAPRVVATAPISQNAVHAGVLVARVIGPLSVLPLGFQFPLNARGLDLVVSDAGGRELVHQVRAITAGSSFVDQILNVPAGGSYTLKVTLTGDNGAVLAGGQATELGVAPDQFTNTTVILQPLAPRT